MSSDGNEPAGSVLEATVSPRPKGSRALTVVLLLIGLVAAHFAVGFCGFPILASVCIAWYFLVRRRVVAFVLLVVLSPVSLAFCVGVVGYWAGTAELWYMGLPGTEFHNLDRQTRCPKATGGCLVNGGEILTLVPHNTAVRLMSAVFGRMRGTYDGPYPTRDEAQAALAHAGPVPLEDLLRDVVLIDGEEIHLDRHVGRDLVGRLSMSMLANDVLEGNPVDERMREMLGHMEAAIWQHRCLVLRIPSRFRGAGLLDPTAEECAMIAVIDREAGRPFAYFGEGGYYHNFPPVDWFRDDGD